MGTGVELIAWAALGTTVASTVIQMEARRDQARANEKIRNEQNATNAQKAAEERRKQIREERVRRAMIEQSSSNSGTGGGSGELGAIGGMSTGLAANLGFNQGLLASAGRISQYSSDAAAAADRGATARDIGNLSSSIFQMAGGAGSLNFGTPTGNIPASSTIRPPTEY